MTINMRKLTRTLTIVRPISIGICVVVATLLLLEQISCSASPTLIRQKRQAASNNQQEDRPTGGTMSVSAVASTGTGAGPTKVIKGDASGSLTAGRPPKITADSIVGADVGVADDEDAEETGTGEQPVERPKATQANQRPNIRRPPKRNRRPTKRPKSTQTSKQVDDEETDGDYVDDRCDDESDDDYDDYPLNPLAGKLNYFKKMMNNAFDMMPGGHFYGNGGMPSGKSFSSGATASALANGDGSSRLASSVSRNGRTRGIVSETSRNGRTKTRRIGPDSRDYDDDVDEDDS